MDQIRIGLCVTFMGGMTLGCGGSAAPPAEPPPTVVEVPEPEPEVDPSAELSKDPALARTRELPKCEPGPGEIAEPCRITEADAIQSVAVQHLTEGKVSSILIEIVVAKAPPQRLRETIVVPIVPPRLQDLNGDADLDLIVPLSSGMVNLTSAIWRGTPEGFRRVGEVSGTSVETTKQGLLAVPARSSAAEWVVRFYRFEEEALEDAGTLTIQAEPASCELSATDEQLEAMDLTQEQATTLLCGLDVAKVF